jgi:hypothetical protein
METVYRQFARYFVEHGDGVKVLYNASGRDLDLPSWVPDWSYRHIARPRIVHHPQTEPDADHPMPLRPPTRLSPDCIRAH